MFIWITDTRILYFNINICSQNMWIKCMMSHHKVLIQSFFHINLKKYKQKYVIMENLYYLTILLSRESHFQYQISYISKTLP